MSYIAHVCLNSKLNKEHPNYCNRGFIDIAPSSSTLSEQCWKYCKNCEEKGYPIITEYIKNPDRVNQCKQNFKKD